MKEKCLDIIEFDKTPMISFIKANFKDTKLQSLDWSELYDFALDVYHLLFGTTLDDIDDMDFELNRIQACILEMNGYTPCDIKHI